MDAYYLGKITELGSIPTSGFMKFCKKCNKPCKIKYCSRSCSASVNNISKQRNFKFGKYADKKCFICDNITSNQIYCSRTCFNIHRDIKVNDKIKSGLYKIACGDTTMLRKYLIKERGRCCELCKFDMWLNKPIPLNVHHKDGDAYNNKLDNLQLLCLNCHGLTENFGNKNKNSTRKNRYK